jgi:thiamine-phosphate pyrophosphorylase
VAAGDAVTGAARRARLAAARLYLVVGEGSCRGPWEVAVRRALASGAVDLVQLREKALDDAAFVARAARLRALLGPDGPLLVLNDRVHLVAACGADGVHVGEDDLPPEEARRRLGPDVLVGCSTHDPTEVAAAAGRGADYVGLGPCFPSSTKALARRPAGAALLRACLPVASLPVFPIGGITPDRVADLVAAGALRVAVGAGILAADDPTAAAAAIGAALRDARSASP